MGLRGNATLWTNHQLSRRLRISEREAEEAADATAPVDVLRDLQEAERSELVAGAMAQLPMLRRESIVLFTFEELCWRR